MYSAAGGHSTYYDDAIYISNGQHGSGVGCDDASQPLTRTDPRPVMIPTTAAPGSEFQWLGFLGHWGGAEGIRTTGPQVRPPRRCGDNLSPGRTASGRRALACPAVP